MAISCAPPSPVQKRVLDFYEAVRSRDERAVRKLMKPGEDATFQHDGVIFPKYDFLAGLTNGTLRIDEQVDFPEYEQTRGHVSTLVAEVKDRRTGQRKTRVFHLVFGENNWVIARVDEQISGTPP